MRASGVDVDPVAWQSRSLRRLGYDWSDQPSAHPLADLRPVTYEVARAFLPSEVKHRRHSDGDRSATARGTVAKRLCNREISCRAREQRGVIASQRGERSPPGTACVNSGSTLSLTPRLKKSLLRPSLAHIATRNAAKRRRQLITDPRSVACLHRDGYQPCYRVRLIDDKKAIEE